MKYTSISQSSKSMAHHRNHNEIPRNYLEEICYSKDGLKLLGICIYRHSPNCPGACPNYNQQASLTGLTNPVDKLEKTNIEASEKNSLFVKPPVLNQMQKFYKKYGEDWRK